MTKTHRKILDAARLILESDNKEYRIKNYRVYKGYEGYLYFKHYYKEIARYNTETKQVEVAVPLFDSSSTTRFLNAILEEFGCLSRIFRKKWIYYVSHPGKTPRIASNTVYAPDCYDFLPISYL